jgi:ubiquinone/menaquinone biosynthesis C-methylase UbiE
VAGDAFQLPFHDASFDVVLCAMLLHEYPDEQVRELLAGLHRISRRALIILELHRHPMAYYFLPATKWLFGWSELTLRDGPTSVAAAFRPGELRRLAREAGLERCAVRNHIPWFRLTLVARH